MHKTLITTAMWTKISGTALALDINSPLITVHFFFVFYIFVTLAPLSCGAGSTVPREGFDSSVIMPFSWCVMAVTLPI